MSQRHFDDENDCIWQYFQKSCEKLSCMEVTQLPIVVRLLVIEGLNLKSTATMLGPVFEVLNSASEVLSRSIKRCLPSLRPLSCGVPSLFPSSSLETLNQWSCSELSPTTANLSFCLLAGFYPARSNDFYAVINRTLSWRHNTVCRSRFATTPNNRRRDTTSGWLTTERQRTGSGGRLYCLCGCRHVDWCQ